MDLHDSLTNLVTGLGTGKDKSIHARFADLRLDPMEIDAMYAGDWIAATIIDAPCDDITREWREWKAGPRQTAALEAEERRLGLRHKVNRALKLARKDGGSAILIGDGSDRPELPLKPQSIGRGGLKYLHVLSMRDVSVGQIERDPLSPHFGEPVDYGIAGANGGASPRFHPSRLVRFHGIEPLQPAATSTGWGTSVLQRVYEAVRNAAATAGNLAALTHEAKTDVFKIPGLTENVVNPDYREKVLTRFALANASKSINNALILDDKETWEQKKISFANFAEVIRQYLEIAAGAGNLPVIRLLGTSPGGLSNGHDGPLRHYYDTQSSKQEVELRPALMPLDEVLIRSALGTNPDGIWYEFKPLWQLTDAELAAVALQKAQTTEIYGQLGIMSKDALREAARSQISEDGIYPGFDGIMERRGNETPEPLIDAKAKPVAAARVSEKPADAGATAPT